MIESRYQGLDQLWSQPPDALIVTGTEPAQVSFVTSRTGRIWRACWNGRRPRFPPRCSRVSPRTRAPSCSTGSSGCHARSSAVACSTVTVEDPYDPLAFGLPDDGPVPPLPGQRRARGRADRRGLSDRRRLRLVRRGLGGGRTPAGRRAVRAVPGPPRVRHAEPAAGVPPRRAPVPVRPWRGALPPPARRLSVPGRGGHARAASRSARQARDADPRELWSSFPFDEVAASVENTWATPSATLYANWLSLARAASTV